MEYFSFTRKEILALEQGKLELLQSHLPNLLWSQVNSPLQFMKFIPKILLLLKNQILEKIAG